MIIITYLYLIAKKEREVSIGRNRYLQSSIFFHLIEKVSEGVISAEEVSDPDARSCVSVTKGEIALNKYIIRVYINFEFMIYLKVGRKLI